MFTPTRQTALDRLAAFAPRAGRDYALMRNHDDQAHVSRLSPYIRHRIITEEEVLAAILSLHSPQTAEKFVQEVVWRSYWKGWLELRPQVWADYRRELDAAINQLQTQAGLRQRWETACLGETGIDGFDHWARELATTGYLHNHARMWFASIWIHTLHLPWTLGADFFLRHLLDGDTASNTLSWRWVGGMQTTGKIYLARPDNIAAFTGGRFRPQGLATVAQPLPCPPHPVPRALPASGTVNPARRTGLVATEDELSPDWILDQVNPVATAFVRTAEGRSPLQTAPMVQEFVAGAMADCQTRLAARLGDISIITPADLPAWQRSHGLEQMVTSYLPVGPAADLLGKAGLVQLMRPFDQNAWPHATGGFFRFRERVPQMLGRIKGLTLV
jgi:deoxyribodipyrimidine photo-lyase